MVLKPKVYMLKAFLATVVVLVLLLVPTAFAVPIVAVEYLNIPYINGTYQFTIQSEQAAYESEIGLFSIESYDPLDYDYTTIFSKNQEPGASNELYVDWSQWDGFYAGVYTGGSTDNTLDHLLLGVFGSNPFAQDYFKTSSTHIYLDDQLGCRDDNDFNDMRISIAATPVPEPATMILLGTGLIGLATVSRKRMFKD